MAPTGRGGRRNFNRSTKLSSTSHPSTSTTLPTSHPSSSKSLPLNLIIQILCRTDAKSLARFRCVSKSWDAMISHPLFLKKHLSINCLSTNTNVICNGYYTGRRNVIKVVSLLRVSKMPVTLLNVDSAFKSGCDSGSNITFAEFSKEMIIAGSINGIVLVNHANKFNGRFVGLWNPAINQWKPVRINRSEGEGATRTVVGLGYDKARDDLKIIRIVTAVSRTDNALNGKWDRVHIYSASEDCWKDVYCGVEISVWSCRFNCSFIANGVPYFSGIDVIPGSVEAYQHQILVGFDPSTGLFKKVPYPERCRVDGTWAKPFEYQDSVAIMVQSNPGSPERQTADMYVLDDNTTSWIQMYSIGPFPSLEYHEPQLSFKTGQILLKEKLQLRGMYLYDPKANRMTHLSGMDKLKVFWSESYSHSESLVTIEGMELIMKNGKNKKTKPKKMNRTELLSENFKSALRL